jgi:hypothetical protein
MEKIIKNEMEDYIALHTYDYILAFCQATNESPGRYTEYSYGKKLINTTRVLSSAQGHPKNENTVWEEKLKNSINLFGDGENCTELHEHAYSEFCFTDTHDIVKYANELNRSKYREVQNYKRELMYNRMYGILWELSPVPKDDFVHEDKLVELQVRLHESIERCERYS